MSSANISLVQSMYAAFGHGDIATILKTVSPDCAWHVNGRKSDFPTFGDFSGRDAVQSFFGAVGQHLDFLEFSPKEFHAADDKVFALGHYAMTIKKTGRKVASDWCHIFTIRDGVVVGFREFTDTAQAAEGYRG